MYSTWKCCPRKVPIQAHETVQCSNEGFDDEKHSRGSRKEDDDNPKSGGREENAGNSKRSELPEKEDEIFDRDNQDLNRVRPPTAVPNRMISSGNAQKCTNVTSRVKVAPLASNSCSAGGLGDSVARKWLLNKGQKRSSSSRGYAHQRDYRAGLHFSQARCSGSRAITE